MVNVVKLATGVMAFHISTDFDQDHPFVNTLLKFVCLSWTLDSGEIAICYNGFSLYMCPRCLSSAVKYYIDSLIFLDWFCPSYVCGLQF